MDYQELASKHANKKRYEKTKQFDYHEEQRQKLSEWREHKEVTLMAEEIDNLFWNELVQLGWRINNDVIISNPKFFAKNVQLMFLCPDCGKALHSQQAHDITISKARAMRNANWLKIVVKRHKENADACHPAEYDENGEVIPEAIPEARPTIFEKPEDGTVRLDTITGTWTIFDGERWIPHAK